MAYDRLVMSHVADHTHRDRLEVELELRNGSSVHHVWVDHREGLAVGSRMRLVSDDVSEGGGWWTVSQVYGTRRVPLVEGIGAFAGSDEQLTLSRAPRAS